MPAYAVAWEWPLSRRCVVCGRLVSEAQVAGHTGRLRFCEACFVRRERLHGAMALAALLRPAVLSGAA